MRMALIFAATLSAYCTGIQAQERPRAPLKIGNGLTQMAPPFIVPRTMAPGGLTGMAPSTGAVAPQLVVAAPAATDVRFVNFGTAVLAMSFWDGASKWTTFQIAPGTSYDLSCATCADDVQIAFHDGTTNKRVDVHKGSSYTITSAANAWVLQKQTPPSQ